jgi:signal transduction histidine kinase
MKIGVPQSVRGQLILLLLGCLLAAQILSISYFMHDKNKQILGYRAFDAVERLLSTAKLLRTLPAADDEAIIKTPSEWGMQFTITDAAPQVRDELLPSDDIAIFLKNKFGVTVGDGFILAATEIAPSHEIMGHATKPGRNLVLLASITLDDGRWLTARDVMRLPKTWAWQLMATILVTILIVVAVVWIIVAKITTPLQHLSNAADNLGRGESPQPISASGPSELKKLTHAFNDMAARLTRLLNERAKMLGAIGHDLKSPITAMRLRIELLDDGDSKDRLGVCLDEIQELVDGALSLSRGYDTTETETVFQFEDLMQELIADLVVAGGDITLVNPHRFFIHGRRGALKRAVRNVVENALRYGYRARIFVRPAMGDVCLLIDDDGPGIPEADRTRVFNPFVRLEESRCRDTGGSGLGLALAKSIIDAHQGKIRYEEADSGGARAVIMLPRLMDQAGAA